MNKSPIEYLAQAESAIGRVGGTLNICTGCLHWKDPSICALGTDCYAYRMVTQGRLKGHPSYPYGFEPTFNSDRVRKIGGKPKLIFLNDMSDVGGDWDWNGIYPGTLYTSEEIAKAMARFALLNPQHIILLLTKNPSWYRLAQWPSNVWVFSEQ